MVKCQKCGTENPNNAVFCQECGFRLGKVTKKNFFKSLDYKALFIGSISALLTFIVPFALLFYALFGFSFTDATTIEMYSFLILIICIIFLPGTIGGCIASYLAVGGMKRGITVSGMKIGIIHGAIAQIGLLLIVWFGSGSPVNPATGLGLCIIYLICGLIGSIIGVWLRRRIKGDMDTVRDNESNKKWGIAFLVFLLIIVSASLFLFFMETNTFLELSEPEKVINAPKSGYDSVWVNVNSSTKSVMVKGKTTPDAKITVYELKKEQNSDEYESVSNDEIKSSGKKRNVSVNNKTGEFEFKVNNNLKSENEVYHILITAKSPKKYPREIQIIMEREDLVSSSSTPAPSTTTTPTPSYSGQDDEAIELVQNYEDPSGFTIAHNVIAELNMLDAGSYNTHQSLWSAEQTDGANYEVTMMITPDEWGGSGGGTAKWKVNVETGAITALDENAKAFMQGMDY